MFAELYETLFDGTYLRLVTSKDDVRVRLSDNEAEMWLDVRDVMRRCCLQGAGPWQQLHDYSNPVYRMELERKT